ncbi:heavy metal translocating P-type ATPase [Haloarcula salina]|uniref:Cation-translocating P-type ATPase n=1 Tax=Haloarcula salina TaxID=1429914 RepID=A0AA41G746_9EURY|nr:cation-translocating P-type ATPase [Haloarcula salina]MBV0901372.1 cation-translocating P-type ATPase [Haloarcula salina]
MTSRTDTDEQCALCGLAVTGTAVEGDSGDRYCCVGCRDVHQTLDSMPAVEPADIRDAVAADEPESVDDSPPEGHERLFLRVNGMHCATCEAFIESLAADTDGITAVAVSYVTETARVDYDPDRLTPAEVRDALSAAGYTATDREDTVAEHAAEEDLMWRVAAGAMLGMWVMMPYVIFVYPLHFGLYGPDLMAFTREQVTGHYHLYGVLFLFTTLVLGYTGGPLLRGAYVSLRTRSPNMDLLVSLAAVSAYLYSTLAAILGRIDLYFDVTIAIVVVVTAGTYYESKIKRSATERLADLHTARAAEATVQADDGTTRTVPTGDLSAGDEVLVRAGDRIPVDGTVSEGDGTVDEAVVTGESLPVSKRPSDTVVGGSVLTDGAIVVEVGEGATSSVDRISDLMWDLQSTNRGIQQLADRLAVVFVPGVLTLALLAGLGYLAVGAGVTRALLVALTVLLVSCPCSLGLATPLAVASAIREAIEHGIVVFDETIFERVRDVDVVVFDKTGTLTTGDLRVVETDAPDDVLAAAAALEQRASHPVAGAIVDAFGGHFSDRDGPPTAADGGTRSDDGRSPAERGRPADSNDSQGAAPSSEGGADALPIEEFQRHGTGVSGRVDGHRVLVGHPDLFADRGWAVPEAIASRAETAREDGSLPVVVGRDGDASGLLVLRDEPREAWSETLAALADRDVEVVVLTGDDERAAVGFADHPAVEHVFAGVPPEGKAETVRRFGRDRCVAMVGDGTNDGPALASADLGIALGGGTALAVDAADIAIVDDDLSAIETVFDLSTAAGARVKQNVGWAFCYNAVAIPVAILGLLNPLVAAAAMASSSLLVVFNSGRALLE